MRKVRSSAKGYFVALLFPDAKFAHETNFDSFEGKFLPFAHFLGAMKRESIEGSFLLSGLSAGSALVLVVVGLVCQLRVLAEPRYFVEVLIYIIINVVIYSGLVPHRRLYTVISRTFSF